MRVVLTATCGHGHLGPLLPFADALAGRGDRVVLVVPPALERATRASGHPYAVGGAPAPEAERAIRQRLATAPAAEASVLANRELFGRLSTEAMLPAVEAACAAERPDLVLHDPAEYAAAVVAARRGLRHAQVAISAARGEWASLDMAAPVLDAREAGIVAHLRATPYVTRFPASLDPSPYPRTHRVAHRLPPPRPLPDWWGGGGGPLVYVTFGSVTAGLPIADAVYRAAVAAVADLPARVVLTVGHDANPVLGDVPAHVHVAQWVPHPDVLAVADLVVCHGGSGTTLDALAAGVPLVVVPLFADQPANARAVEAAGAGAVVAPRPGPDGGRGTIGPSDAPRLAAAIAAVLAAHAPRAAARRLAAEMGAAPGVGAVLDALAGTVP